MHAPRRRQPAEGHVVIFLAAFHIESRQPQRCAHGKRGGDDPDCLVVQVGELGAKFDQQKGRRDPESDQIAKAVKFTIGLFCAATYYVEGIKHLIHEFSDIKSLDEIETLDYRGGAAPGSLMATTKDKRIYSIASKHDYTWHFLGPATFKRDRCIMCVDFAAELADISCGDIFQPVIPGRKHGLATIPRTDLCEGLVKG